MASTSKGKGSVKTLQFWKHLKWCKRSQNKLVRKDAANDIQEWLKVDEPPQKTDTLADVCKKQGVEPIDKEECKWNLFFLSNHK